MFHCCNCSAIRIFITSIKICVFHENILNTEFAVDEGEDETRRFVSPIQNINIKIELNSGFVHDLRLTLWTRSNESEFHNIEPNCKHTRIQNGVYFSTPFFVFTKVKYQIRFALIWKTNRSEMRIRNLSNKRQQFLAKKGLIEFSCTTKLRQQNDTKATLPIAHNVFQMEINRRNNKIQ